MKKLITFLAMLVACVGLAIGAVACGKNGTSSRSHVHNYDVEKTDENYHWTECACGVAAEKVAHNYDVEKTDENYHWTECACGEATEKVAHSYDTEKKDKEHHWGECACGAVTEKVAHDFIDDECTGCAYQKPSLEYALSEDASYYVVTGIGTITDTDIVIPSTYKGLPVTAIGGESLDFCSNLTSVVISDGVSEIRMGAFYACGNLTNIVIPSTVTKIGDSAFANCRSLTNIDIPDSVIEIGDSAFSNCTNLKEVVIPDGLTTINGAMFKECSSLTSVTIGYSVNTIRYDAFLDCTSLESIFIPKSVTRIQSAFGGCSGLTSITVDTENETYTSIDGNLYNKEGTTLYQYALGKTATEFIVPDSVTTIGGQAFSGCESLTSIVIPDSVTEIGYEAFYGCTGLTSIVIPDSVTKIGYKAFYYCDNLQTIYCEVERQPSGWDLVWKNGCSATVVWGYKGE